MHRTLALFPYLLVVLLQTISAQTLSQREACERFSKSIVRLEAGGVSLGTGFLVSKEGTILTAGHVITDKTTGTYFSVIEAVLDDGSHHLARVLVPLTASSVGQDYAVLKVDGKSDLPFLPLGSDKEATIGSDATIIGYPFSAITIQDQRVSTKFCLAANIAAVDLLTAPVTGTHRVNQRDAPFKVDIKVEVIYFQGPSVKGISGSPIISRDTGKVIGIVTLKLTGITPALADLREKGKHGGIAFSGIGDPGIAFGQVIDVLDQQLANGLGAATGIDDPAHALNMSKTKK